MKVLWLFAHPDQQSLNAGLRDEGLRTLTELGHEYQLSDLYAMKWDPLVWEVGAFDEDVVAEQEKLRWADAFVVQYPMWWYGVPAIMKGWFDRVFARGFGYGVKAEDGTVLRYGEGKLTGKRAMIITTVGGRRTSLGPRGVNGDISSLLFPLQHGTFWYAGMSALPPVVIYGADRVEFSTAAAEVRTRVAALPTAEPIRYRYQNSGDYDENLALRPDFAPGRTGLEIHQA
ncbi:MAG TPA: NAD(P)H-dependent oxidoreductase [Amycolatopsis sp.]|nr:NAD(P)H-dependent oxidoreductase [Amycolatopsis sp.]